MIRFSLASSGKEASETYGHDSETLSEQYKIGEWPRIGIVREKVHMYLYVVRLWSLVGSVREKLPNGKLSVELMN